MKKLVKFGSFALCLTLCAVMLTACGGKKTTTIGKTDVAFYSIAGSSAATAVNATNVSEKNGLITVEVTSGTYAVEVDLKPFLDKNTKVLGNGFTFTRSDMSGTGYAYELVGEGTEPATANTWKKYGSSDTAVAESTITGPKLFIMENEERTSVYLFQDQSKQTPADVFTADQTYTFNFKGDNGKKYELKVKVAVKPAVVTTGVSFNYFAGAADAVAVDSGDVGVANGVITVEVSAGTYCVEANITEFLATAGIIGNDFTFTRSDMSGTGYAYQLVTETAVAANNEWKKYGASDDDKIVESAITGPKLFYASAQGIQSVYLFQDQANQATTAVFTADKTYTFTFNGHNGIVYELTVKVVVAAE